MVAMANIDDRWTSAGKDGQRVPNSRYGSGQRWRARYYDSAGHQHARHFPRKIDAQRWLDSVVTAVGSSGITKTLTLHTGSVTSLNSVMPRPRAIFFKGSS